MKFGSGLREHIPKRKGLSGLLILTISLLVLLTVRASHAADHKARRTVAAAFVIKTGVKPAAPLVSSPVFPYLALPYMVLHRSSQSAGSAHIPTSLIKPACCPKTPLHLPVYKSYDITRGFFVRSAGFCNLSLSRMSINPSADSQNPASRSSL